MACRVAAAFSPRSPPEHGQDEDERGLAHGAAPAGALPMLNDQASFEDVIWRCFGKDGNLTVVVPGNVGDVPGVFKVWSSVLCQWSQVFKSMFEHDFRELATAEVVIVDFPPAAVEAFLRFMYSGTLRSDHRSLLDVARLADKYIVPPLQALCQEAFALLLTPETALEMMRLAEGAGAAAERQRCLEMVLSRPEEALRGASARDAAAAEEVLASPDLFVSDSALLSIFLAWGESGAAAPERVAALIRGHVEVAALSEEQYNGAVRAAIGADCAGILGDLAAPCKQGSHTADVVGTLWTWCAQGERSARRRQEGIVFLGYWLNLIPRRPYSSSQGVEGLQAMARGAANMCLGAGDEMVWMLPHHAVYLTGIAFSEGLGDAHVRVFASPDGAAWKCLWDSGTQGGLAKGAVIGCRSRECVQWIRLRVCRGQYTNKLTMHGIVKFACTP